VGVDDEAGHGVGAELGRGWRVQERLAPAGAQNGVDLLKELRTVQRAGLPEPGSPVNLRGALAPGFPPLV